MKWTMVLTLGVLAFAMILMACHRPKNVVSEEWIRDNRYSKDGY